jgi:hypothetical protein
MKIDKHLARYITCDLRLKAFISLNDFLVNLEAFT